MIIAVDSAMQSNSAVTESKRNTLDGEDFMQLLLLQLQHQNPLEPMSEQEFGAQLAQYNTLSEMQKVNQNLQSLLFLQAGNLIGQEVNLINGESGEIEGVSIQNKALTLWVGGKEYSLSEVAGVGEV